MTTQVATTTDIDDRTILSLVTDGDCSKLSDQQKLAYYKARCDVAGLDFRAQPFQFLRLNGKLVLYALKSCTDQLAAKHGIRCEILNQQTEEGIRVVTVRAIAQDGRQTDEIGAVSVKGLAGESLCNALMKASTKAKRRAVLAVCGLGMLDESELDTVAGARPETSEVSEPTVMMPRRLSEQQPVVVEAAAEPVAVPDVTISENDRRYLEKLRRDNNHDRDAVKRWLARRGFASSKDITVSAFGAIRDRLSDPSPLEV